jgi:hypothetical protein
VGTASTAADVGFRVHLDSLERFVQELDTQIEGLRMPADRLAVLTERQLPLGAFGEAYELSVRHLTVADQMYSVLQAVREAVGFAGEVTRTVATAYQRFDTQATASLSTVTDPQPSVGQQSFIYSDPARAPLVAPGIPTGG